METVPERSLETVPEKSMKTVHRKLEVYVGIALVAFSVVILYGALPMDKSGDFGPGPGFLPTIVGVALLGLSVLYLATAVFKSQLYVEAVFPARAKLMNAVVTVGSVIMFTLILPLTGFVIASSLMLFLLFSRGYRRRWAVLFAVGISLLVFALFRLALGIPLPVNTLGF